MKNRNKKYSILLLSLWLMVGTLTAQHTISGQILDAASNAPLAYVNIGIEGTSTGTVSDPQGAFTLIIPQSRDTFPINIRCSHIGYEDVEYTLQLDSADPLAIIMNARITELNTVQIRASKLYPDVLGYEKTDTRMNVSFAIGDQPNQNLGAAIAKKVDVKKDETVWVDSVSFFIRANNFDTVRFRVNIHQLTPDKLPGNTLHTSEIIAELTQSQTGWVTVNFIPLGITMPEDFAISVEWIYHSVEGKYLQMPIALPVVGSTHYYRYGSQNSWENYRNMSAAIQVYVRKEVKSKRKRKGEKNSPSELSFSN
ncbi:MAG: carboxypeptidase-like regulatory domain-containing protein [Saprospiraceae bacterium]